MAASFVFLDDFLPGLPALQKNWGVGWGGQGLDQVGCALDPAGKGGMEGASFWLLAPGTFS